jgi:hypothetical protein
VASYLASRMSKASKCRAADDLLLLVENYPSVEDARLEFALRSAHELIRISIGDAPLPIRALAAW